MMTARTWFCALLAAIIALAVGRSQVAGSHGDEPHYDGKSLIQWLSSLEDPTVEVRRKAAEALGYLGPESKAPMPALRTALTDSDKLVREHAAESLFRIDHALGYELQSYFESALVDADPMERRRAAETLGEIGLAARHALPLLRAALKDLDKQVSFEAATALAFIDPFHAEDAVPKLIDALEQGQAVIGIPPPVLALRSIGRAKTEIVPTLVAALKARDRRTSLGIVCALGLIGPPAKQAVAPLSATLRNADTTLALCAGEALFLIDPALAPSVVPVAVAALKSPDSQTFAAQVLTEIGPIAKNAAPALLETLEKAKEGDSIFVDLALGEIGTHAKETVPGLVQLLNSPNDVLQLNAAIALSVIGPPAKAAAPTLNIWLQKQEPPADSFAIEALVRIDPDRSLALIPNLVAMLKARREACGAVEALADVGPPAKAAVPALLVALKEWDGAFRPLAMRALVRIDPARSKTFLPELINSLKRADLEERRDAVRTIAAMGPAASDSVPALIAALGDPDLCLEAADALGLIGAAANQAVPSLLVPLRDQDELKRRKFLYPLQGSNDQKNTNESCFQDAIRDERVLNAIVSLKTIDDLGLDSSAWADRITGHSLSSRCARALGKMGEAAKQATPVLLEARHDPDPEVRVAAACAMVRIAPGQSADVIPCLVAALKNPDWGIRSRAATALEEIGQEAHAAVPELARLLKDPVRFVRRASGTALKEIDSEAARELGVPTKLRL